MNDKHALAIIIPAYKPDFFHSTLASLAAQTDKRFRVYVGDDAGPAEIRKVCEGFVGSLDIRYHRFDENLGGRDLVSQWERCIALSDEPWIWLFCDDDVMAPDCVSSFYAHLEKTGGQFDLYRFNTSRIDSEGKTIYTAPQHPPLETSLEFVCSKMSLKRDSFVSEYIFSREVHERKCGFVNFPLAWCADDATWVKYGEEKGVYTIPQSRVYWRQSGVNVSMGGRIYHTQKLDALVAYMDWLTNLFAEVTRVDEELQQQFTSLQKRFFLAHLGLLAPFGFKSYLVQPCFPKVFSASGMIRKTLILLRFDFHYYINNVKHYFCANVLKCDSLGSKK